MGARIPMRETVGDSRPQQIKEFGDKLHAQLQRVDKEKRLVRERSGKISGGKLGQPTLWAVLDIIGVPREFDPYLLGKFQRGNDVEDRAINFLTGLDPREMEDNYNYTAPQGSILTGEFATQVPMGYRGGVGYLDLVQVLPDRTIYHEIKSSTKMAYDRVAATGRSHKNTPSPYYHHELQLAYYCLGGNVDQAFLHYFNADDYRLTSFAIVPAEYEAEINKEIDDIELAFASKQLPAFEGFLDYHKAYMKTTYGDWNYLSPDQMMDKLERQYPEAYKTFMEMK